MCRYWRLATILLLASAAFAHDSEPINTEFAAPFAFRAGNIQFGLQYFRNAESYDLVPVEFEYGFAPRMQFSVVAPLTRREVDGETFVRPGNVEIAYRYLLAGGNERKFALSINPEVVLPIGDKRVAERAWELGAAVHLDLHPLPGLWTHTNLGYETPVSRFEEKEKTFFYRLAVMYELRHHIQPVLELVGEHDFDSQVSHTAIVPEVIFIAAEHWEIKAGVPLGLTDETPAAGVQVQFTWKFGEGRR